MKFIPIRFRLSENTGDIAELRTFDIIAFEKKSHLKKKFHDFRNVPDRLDEIPRLKAIPDQKNMKGLIDLVAFPQTDLLGIFKLCTGQICAECLNRISNPFVPITKYTKRRL